MQYFNIQYYIPCQDPVFMWSLGAPVRTAGAATTLPVLAPRLDCPGSKWEFPNIRGLNMVCVYIYIYALTNQNLFFW